VTAKGDIGGSVTDKAGEPVSGAKSEVIDSAGNKNSTTTDSSGSYTLNEIAEGKAEVNATCENGEDTQTKIVDVNCIEGLMVDFVLDCKEPGNYNGYFRYFQEGGDPNSKGGYLFLLYVYDFTFDFDDDGMINGSGLGYSEWEMSWWYFTSHEDKGKVTCKTGPMPFSVEISGQIEGNNLLLDQGFYLDAHVIWDCTPRGKAPIHEGVDWGLLGPAGVHPKFIVPIISEEPFEACLSSDWGYFGLTNESIYCQITE
jgi:hypothetical protein